MIEQIKEVFIESFFITAIVIPSVSFLLKRAFNKKLEEFKSNLDENRQKELERYKAGLQFQIKEHDTRFDKLHEKRMQVIGEIYALLGGAISRFRVVMCELNFEIFEEDPKSTVMSTTRLALKEIHKLQDYFEKNKIFLEQKIAADIEHLIESLRGPNYQIVGSLNHLKSNEKEFQEKFDNWMNKWNTLTDEIKTAQLELEKQFREVFDS